MEARKKRLTLDLDPAFQRRLKVAAALKGISMRRYCQTAIDRELNSDEANGAFVGSFNIERLIALQEEAFGDKVLPGDGADRVSFARLEAGRDEIVGDRVFQGDSAEFIREARESRNIS